MTKKEEQTAIKVKKSEDFSEWYNEVILKSELAEHSTVSGFMVIRPSGYEIWEKIVSFFDNNIKKLGVKNAYFPLLIPESFFKKEAEHAEGFAPELAWVNRTDDDKSEKLAIRPTSETIIYDSYSRWIRSHRDLPLRLNQWCNVLRWEVKQTKLFLRTREFLWQEGHCVYQTKEECDKETRQYLEEYRKVVEGLLAIPVISGIKTEAEKFAGALYTTTIEALMPDGKALQMATSHNLGQGFAKSFNIKYIGEDKKEHLPWQNSWGLTTRTIGAMVMVHSDDKGLVIPPRIAENKVVIVPIIFKDKKEEVISKAKELMKQLSRYNPILDDREEYSAGWKFNEWELKGIPLRIEIGPKDLEKEHVVVVRRDLGKKELIKFGQLDDYIKDQLEKMQDDLYDGAKKFLTENTKEATDWKQFNKLIQNKKLVKTFFCGDKECEADIKDKTGGATSRCIPFDDKEESKCVNCSKKGVTTYFGKSY